jgi:ribonuclease T1
MPVGVLKYSGQLQRLSVGNRVVKLVIACFLYATQSLPGIGYAKSQAENRWPDGAPITAMAPEMGETYGHIRQGGRSPLARDGVVFGNLERMLPLKCRGYYRECTVKTSNSVSRGIQRIDCGGPQNSQTLAITRPTAMRFFARSCSEFFVL